MSDDEDQGGAPKYTATGAGDGTKPAGEARRTIGLAPGAPEAAAGQDAKKYSTSNPVVVRLFNSWAKDLINALDLDSTKPDVVVDVGVGEGLALERVIGTNQPIIGVEYRLDKLRLATKRLPALAGVVADAGMVPLADHSVDLVSSIEVLEHLTHPELAVAEFARLVKSQTGRVVVSVPWEPWFRLGNLGRGKNIARFGNDPEHVQQFNPKRLRSLLQADFEQVQVKPSFPWLIAVATKPLH